MLNNEELLPRNIRMKRLHSDNAKEFISNEMKKYLIEIGAKGTTTTPYSSKETSHIERFNRTEDEGVSAMLFLARFIP